MKKQWKLIILIIVLLVAVAGVLLILKNRAPKETHIDVDNIDDAIEAIDEATEAGEIPEYGSGIDFEEEADGAQLSFSKSDVKSYYGTWEATSDQAIYLYGRIKLTINEDKTWHGIVVDEEEKGTWTFDGTKMDLSSEFFNVSLSFTEDGKMVMQEDREGDGEYLNTVLTKAE